ncbi:ATP-binding protein [Natrarchaeobius chitinivorans]|uniref:ATP-binding protein n=1 Tax=Natrarchaeobius chitinivorans TaxID=1679083 RepID=A0A3N6MJ36_NATCH|nr:ATP-binding protein [Natrarchaeobius chitinivorans]RQG95791.1 ATP-binding protein [Natrarchaeobius chitinivorans]
MSTTSTETEVTESEPESGTRHVAFVGDAGAGKTTIAALVAARLSERTRVHVTGEAAQLVNDRDEGTDGALGLEWTVDDCPPDAEAIGARAERLDAAFIVATPETLESVARYERRANRHDVDCFLVVNRFRESERDRLRTFDGPELAEYFYDDEAVSTATAADRVPSLSEWTVEAILIEALQPERQPAERALEALECGERSIVNVEVTERADVDSVVDSFETAGFHAAYFECNCKCHDGHVLARRRLA